DIGPVGVHAEAAYTWGLSGLGTGGPIQLADRFLRAVAGVELKPTSGLILEGEYYFNGYGALDPSQYLAKLRRPRELSGEVFGAGRHYAALAAIWRATELLSLTATVIANLQDPSAVLFPVLEYWFEQSVIVRIGGY